MPITIALGIIVALVAAGAIALLATSWYQHGRKSDLGAVSHQWIAENRFGQGRSDSQR